MEVYGLLEQRMQKLSALHAEVATQVGDHDRACVLHVRVIVLWRCCELHFVFGMHRTVLPTLCLPSLRDRKCLKASLRYWFHLLYVLIVH